MWLQLLLTIFSIFPFLITASDLKKAVCEKKLFDKIVSGWRYQVFAKELEQLIINF